MPVTLIPILPAEVDPFAMEIMPDGIKQVVEQTRKLYDYIGFHQPWIGYLALDDQNDAIVGTCGFKSLPSEGRVEIAYFTFPNHEGRGIATEMGRELLRLAREADTEVTIFAQTLPEESASTQVLKNLGFEQTKTVEHPEDGKVWEWEAHGAEPEAQ